MRRVYSWIARGAAPLAFAVVVWHGFKDRSYWHGLTERFGGGKTLTPSEPARSIWVHAVSLGEMSAAAPLIRAIRRRHPAIPLVVTTATPAGRARAQALFTAGVDIRFLPYDTPGAMRRFMARIRPRLGIIMETELWPNLFEQAQRRGIPVILASARLSAKSVSRYRRLGKLFSAVFTDNVLVAAQSADDAERFRAIGAAAVNTQVVGNVKFDLELDAGAVGKGSALRAELDGAQLEHAGLEHAGLEHAGLEHAGLEHAERERGAPESRPVWIAGSTHAGEDEQVLDAHALLLAQRPSALLLLAPRHKDRFAAVAELLTRRGFAFARRSEDLARGALPQVLLVDTMGELVTLYAAADVAFVGGSLVPIGGHNLLEPAALGLPVLTGPSHFNGKDIAQLLLKEGAALQVADARSLAATLQRLLGDSAERRRLGSIGKALVESNRGSVARLLALIEPLLAAHPSAAGEVVRP